MTLKMTKPARRQKPITPNQRKGLPIHNPVSIEERYKRELVALSRQMAKETKAAVLELFRSPDAREYFAQDASIAIQARSVLNLLSAKFSRIYSRHAQILARRMIDDVDAQSKATLMKSFKELTGQVTLRIEDMPRDMFEASIENNVQLIKSIPERYLNDVSGSVLRSITDPNGGGIGKLQEDLRKYQGISERKAKMIAMQETRRAYQSVNIERSKAAGVKKGIWIHTGGTKEPRPKHKAYNGQEFDLSKGAPIGDKGDWVFPSQEINCRCSWTPVIDFDDM